MKRVCQNWWDLDEVCPSGERCTGSSACGSTWYCEREYPQCSAAAPFMACGCEGRVVSVAAGCISDRYAWAFSIGVPPRFGQACAAEAIDGQPRSIYVHGTGFEDFAKLRLYRNDLGQVFEYPVVDGAVAALFEPGPNDARQTLLVVHADRNGNGACEKDEDFTGAFYPSAWDGVNLRLTVELSRADLTAGCMDFRR